jgi:transposase-like protein
MSTRTAKRTRWTAEDARAILELWKGSGLSLQKFAAQQGVQVQRLHRWKQLLGETSVNAFVEVPLHHVRASAPVEVVLTDGVVVRVCEPGGIPLAVELVSALARHRSC